MLFSLYIYTQQAVSFATGGSRSVLYRGVVLNVKNMNRQIWFFGLTFILVGIIFTSLILLFDPSTNINIYSLSHIIILFSAGIGLILKKRVGWIFSHIFAIECTTLYVTSVLINRDSPYFGEDSEGITIAAMATIVGLTIVWSIYFLNGKKTLTLYNVNNLTRGLTLVVGILIAVYNIYRV